MPTSTPQPVTETKLKEYSLTEPEASLLNEIAATIRKLSAQSEGAILVIARQQGFAGEFGVSEDGGWKIFEKPKGA